MPRRTRPAIVDVREASTTLAGQRVDYRLRRSSRRRTVTLTVDAERGLVVHCPLRFGRERLEAVLQHKSRWILAKTAQAAAQRVQQHSLPCREGSPLPYLGTDYPLRVRANGKRALWVTGEALHLGLPTRTLHGLDADGLRAQLIAAYKAEARAVIEARVAHFAALLGVTPRLVRIKAQRKRWGSCSAKGALNFNWRLILAPAPVLDYVVAHEVCHLLHLDHSPRFWARVRGVLPHFRAAQAWLREHGQGLYAL